METALDFGYWTIIGLKSKVDVIARSLTSVQRENEIAEIHTTVITSIPAGQKHSYYYYHYY